ncbi:tRNA pseudouridine(55) synthase TruB [bacterium]|nr:tRNA pseudouridine(55) synthase TruB [bacterium]
MFGFLNIYKPKGWTSFDVVAKIRKIVNIKSVGHTGTLDPFATGVLPVCIGKSTKLIEYLPDDKEYIATVKFGSNTDTYDLEGQVTQTFDKKVEKKDVEYALKLFEGEIEQTPPIYSAIKVNGKKLYEYARNGQNVEIKSRKVYIYKIELLEFDDDSQIAKIKIACSKGTYIRSIAYDLGAKLGCGGYLIALERTKAGMFNIDNSININEIINIKNHLINPLDVLPQPKYILNDEEKEHVSHGRSIKQRYSIDFSINSKSVVFLVYGGKMYGVGVIEEGLIKVKKVFKYD